LPLGFISLFITPIYTTFSTIVAPLYAKYKVMGNETNKSMSVLDFIVNTLFYKKSLFFILATVSLASNAKTYLGPMALVGVIVATIIGYFIGLYSTPNYEQDITNYYSVNLANQEVKKAKASVSREKVKICHKVKEIQMTNTNTFEEGGPLEQEDALNIRGGGKRQATINKNKKYNIKFV